MSLFKLTLKSMLSRKLVCVLLVLSIGLSSMLLIGVQNIKYSAKESFSRSISGTDLIVGARSGDIQLLLYTIFRHGQPVANMSWESVNAIASFSEVAWVVPLSLGDSHQGYPVLGTTTDYFQHYKYGKKRLLAFRQGEAFSAPRDVVLGADVAHTLGYTLGDTLYLSHGVTKGMVSLHDDTVFRVVGILKPTGTPVDKTVHVSLEGLHALHGDDGAASMPESVTGCLVGLRSKFTMFMVQRRIIGWSEEPLMAIIPGVTLSQLWGSIRPIDAAFFVISVLVTLIAFIGLLLALFMSLQQRRRELMILRALGAHPYQLCVLLVLESVLITTSGVVFGLLLMVGAGHWLSPFLEEKMGLVLSLNTFSSIELYVSVAIVGMGVLTSAIPALLVYKKGVSEGSISL